MERRKGRFALYKQRKSAAMRIQCLLRMKKARGIANALRAERNALILQKLRWDSAIKIEKVYRGFVGRNIYKHMKYVRAVVKVQSMLRMWRCKLMKRNLQCRLKAVIRIQCAARKLNAKTLIKIQRMRRNEVLHEISKKQEETSIASPIKKLSTGRSFEEIEGVRDILKVQLSSPYISFTPMVPQRPFSILKQSFLRRVEKRR